MISDILNWKYFVFACSFLYICNYLQYLQTQKSNKGGKNFSVEQYTAADTASAKHTKYQLKV